MTTAGPQALKYDTSRNIFNLNNWGKFIISEDKLKFTTTVTIDENDYSLGYIPTEKYPLTEKQVEKIWKSLSCSMAAALRDEGKIINPGNWDWYNQKIISNIRV